MKEIIETLNIHGFTVEIYHDEDAENPRYWDCSSTLCTAHRRYTFGGERLPTDACDISQAFEWHLAEKGLSLRDIICEPVYMYDHSGIALNTTGFSCTWDSGQLGFIYEVRSEIRREFGSKRISSSLEQKIRDRMKSEIDELGAWANGDVYMCRIPEIDEIGCGFYGTDHRKSGLVDFARVEIEGYIIRQRRKHFAKLKRLIKSSVNMNYRPNCPV